MLRKIGVCTGICLLWATGCHEHQDQPPNQSPQQQVQQPVSVSATGPASQASEKTAAPAEVASSGSQSSKEAQSQTLAPPSRGAKELAEQLNYEEEGGTRAGGYELWVRVLHNGTPVEKAIVGALNDRHKIVAKAYTNGQGDARLIVAEGSYLLVAQRRQSKAEKQIAFARSHDYTLEITP